jgi:hypothetical protein
MDHEGKDWVLANLPELAKMVAANAAANGLKINEFFIRGSIRIACMISVSDRFTRLANEAIPRRDKRIADGRPTVTIDQLDKRYHQFCSQCKKFDGVICSLYGCPTQQQPVDRYFNFVLNPEEKCEYVENGFPSEQC